MFRRIVAALLIILATILAPFAVAGLWAERTLTNTDVFVETVAPLADDPHVQQAVATEVSSALVEAVDAENRLKTALGNLSGPVAQLVDSDLVINSIASGINGAIESGVQSYAQSDRFGEIWLPVSTALQEQFVHLINRDTSNAAVTLQEGQIVLDTKVAAEKVQADLVARGVPFADQLDRVPGRDVVLADTPNLQRAADILHIALPIASWLWLAVLLMFLAGVLLWRPRARGLLWAGVGMTLAGVVSYVALNFGSNQLVSDAPSANFAALLESLSTTLLRFLLNAVLVMICLGLAWIAGGWLAGGTKSGHKVRLMIADAAHRWGAPLSDGWLGRFTSEHPMFVPTLRGIVLALAVVYLIAVDRLTPGQVFWTAVAVAAALLAIEVVEGTGLARERAHAGALVAEAPHPASAGVGDAGSPPE